MVFVAYYFFSKAVQGHKEKVVWKTVMKGLLIIGFLVDILILINFIGDFYGKESIKTFKEYISKYGF